MKLLLNEKVQEYVEQLIPKRSDLLNEMEAYAHEHHTPIMELVGIEALLQLLRIQQPKSILEVGTAIGYSAIRMADSLPNASIVSIERDDERYNKAIEYISLARKSDQIKVIHGDALLVGEKISSLAPFDVIFIDAAKGQYKRFFELYAPYIAEGGVIITDNVLYKGLVTETNFKNRRTKSLVQKINSYNQWLMSHTEFNTAILPIGDGMAISKKR